MTHEENNNNANTQQHAWQRIEEHFRNGKPLAMHVVEATPKRWLVEFEGVRGIVEGPYVYGYTIDTSESPITPEGRIKSVLENMRGKSMLFKVVEADRKRSHLIVSQQLYTDEEQEKTLRELRPGDIRQGIVTSTTRSVVHVNVDGARGWITRGYLAQQLVPDASKVVQVGQEIQVMVLENGQSRLTLSLVHAQLRDEVLQTIHVGQVLTGNIMSLSSEGVYVDLGGPLGYIFADQIVHSYITHPADVFHSGQEVVVKVESIDESKRVVMSLLEAH